MENFKKLLLVALGRASCLDRPFTAEVWDEIFSIAKKQALKKGERAWTRDWKN